MPKIADIENKAVYAASFATLTDSLTIKTWENDPVNDKSNN